MITLLQSAASARRTALIVGVLALIVAGCRLAAGPTIPGATPESLAALGRGEWPTYAGTYASARYSPLDQINRQNVGTLRIAWRWTSPDRALRDATPNIDPSWLNESTPVMLNGVLYTTTSLSQVAAIDAVTGQTKWAFDPGVHTHGLPANNGWLHHGVAYWRDGNDERVIMLTAHAFMIALDAKTGRPMASFGEAGWVDLSQDLGRPVYSRSHYSNTSPPVIVRDVIVVGSSVTDFPLRPDMPPGDVRAFDVRTGKKVWTFRAVPQRGELGNETWENESWKVTGADRLSEQPAAVGERAGAPDLRPDQPRAGALGVRQGDGRVDRRSRATGKCERLADHLHGRRQAVRGIPGGRVETSPKS